MILKGVVIITDRQLRNLLIDVAKLKANIYRKKYNATKYKCVSFRFDKNLLDYNLFKQKLTQNGLNLTSFFTNIMQEYIKNN